MRWLPTVRPPTSVKRQSSHFSTHNNNRKVFNPFCPTCKNKPQSPHNIVLHGRSLMKNNVTESGHLTHVFLRRYLGAGKTMLFYDLKISPAQEFLGRKTANQRAV